MGLLLTKDSEVKDFLNYFYKLNQVFKNCISDKSHPLYSCYSIKNGRIFSFNESSLMNSRVELDFSAKKLAKFEEDFNEMDLYVNGQAFYSFMQENKKHVNGIEYNDKGLLFKTSIPEVEFLVPKLDNTSNDIKLYKEQLKTGIISFIKPARKYDEIKLNSDIVMDFLESKGAYILNISDVKIRLTKKSIFGVQVKTKTKTVNKEKVSEKITSDVTITLYETDTEDVYVLRIDVDNSNFDPAIRISNFCAIINY